MSAWSRLRQMLGGRPIPTTFIPVSAWPDESFSGWNMPLVQAALDETESGNLQEAGRLMVAMGRDPLISHGLRLRVMSLLSSPATLDYTEGLDRHAYEALCDWWFHEGFSPDALASTARYRIMCGVAPADVTWPVHGRYFMPRLTPQETGHLSYNHPRRLWQFIGQDKVHEFRPDGETWVLFRELGSLNSWHEGAIRPLAALWWMKHAVIRFWFNYARTHGNALRVVKLPAQQREKEDVRALIKLAQQLVGGSVIPLPQYPGGLSFDFELLEAKAATWETFPAFIAMVDEYITLLLLGAVDNTRGLSGQGSRARAEVHERQSNKYLSSDAVVTATPAKLVLRAWCKFNRIPVHLAPVPRYEVAPIESQSEAATVRKTNAEALKTALEAAALLEQRGVVPDYPAIAKAHGVPVRALQRAAGQDAEPQQLAA